MREGPEHKSLPVRQEYLTSPAVTPVRKTLATFGHARLKREIVKLLRDNVRDGGIGSILRKDLQRKLAGTLKRDHALTKVERKEIEKRLSNAVAALRKQFDPPLQPDRGDRRIRLIKDR
jgi:hypothetical protein